MGNLRVIVFDVEHGFCAFVKSPTGHTLLIDCGKGEKFSPIKYVIENELSGTVQHDGYKLTQFIVTHPHDDHIEDIDRLMKDFKPAIIHRQKDYDWDEVKKGETEGYENLDKYSEWQATYNQPIKNQPDWGMELNIGPYLSSNDAKKLSGSFVNNSSIPVFISYRGYKFVFPGDLEKAGWLELLGKDDFKTRLKGTNFFVAAHHGHSSGYTKEIYETMGKPYFNIVSIHHGDESIEKAYSSSDNAIGVGDDGSKRYMFTTRADGSIIIDVPAEGNATYNLIKLDDNL